MVNIVHEYVLSVIMVFMPMKQYVNPAVAYAPFVSCDL